MSKIKFSDIVEREAMPSQHCTLHSTRHCRRVVGRTAIQLNVSRTTSSKIRGRCVVVSGRYCAKGFFINDAKLYAAQRTFYI